MAADSWWARQRENSDRDLAAQREQLRRRLEYKKQNPSKLKQFLRDHRMAMALVVVISLATDYFVGGIWLLVIAAVAIPVAMFLGYRYRSRLRGEGWNI